MSVCEHGSGCGSVNVRVNECVSVSVSVQVNECASLRGMSV